MNPIVQILWLAVILGVCWHVHNWPSKLRRKNRYDRDSKVRRMLEGILK